MAAPRVADRSELAAHLDAAHGLEPVLGGEELGLRCASGRIDRSQHPYSAAEATASYSTVKAVHIPIA